MMAYFADVMPGRAASVVASYNVCRNIAAGMIAVLTPDALMTLHSGWFMTIMAGLCAVFSINLEITRRMGPYWRARWLEKEEEAKARKVEMEMETPQTK
jgi:hypothetical protein